MKQFIKSFYSKECPAIVLLPRVDDITDKVPDDWQVSTCKTCGNKVALSPANQEIMSDEELWPYIFAICVPCAYLALYPYPHLCKRCGMVFVQGNTQREYCSDRCKYLSLKERKRKSNVSQSPIEG